jgi:hypothetical protein
MSGWILLVAGVCEPDTFVPSVQQNQAARNFLSPELEVMWRTVVIIIRVVLVSPYLCIRDVSLSPIHYNQSRRVYINQRHQYIRLIWSYKINERSLIFQGVWLVALLPRMDATKG